MVTAPMDRNGSVFVVFRERATEPRHEEPTIRTQSIAKLHGPGQVAFQADRGAPATATFQQLRDFRENSGLGILYFSGVATYTQAVQLPAQASGEQGVARPGGGDDLAEVWVNGSMAGTTWKPPYRVDVTSLIKPGSNVVDVRAVNLWLNRLIGDVQPGVTKKFTFTAADGEIEPGTHVTERPRSATMPYRADAPLRPSGLIGPVTVVVEPTN